MIQKNIYEIDFYEAGRSAKRIRIRLDAGLTEEQARIACDSLIAQKKNRPVKPIDLGLTISALTLKYLEWYEMYRAPMTFKDVRRTFEGPVDLILGKIVAEDLQPRHILDYQKRRREDKVSNRTINKELAYLSGCLRWAAETENAFISPRTWKIKSLPYDRPIPQVLTPDEVNRILEVAEPFYRAMILCLYSLGLRMNEARMLRWKDVDRENKTITVKQKGGSFKRLPAGAMLLSALDEIQMPVGCRRGKRHPESKSDSEYVFFNQRSEKPVFDIRRAIERACKKAGVERHVNPHLFRHSVATHLMGDGESLGIIQRYLGHSQIAVTEFYLHVGMQHLRGASDLIEASLTRKPEGR